MAATLKPHELSLHVANSCGRVAVCSCGWYGIVHPAHPGPKPSARSRRAAAEAAEGLAAAEHRHHVTLAGPITWTMPAGQFVPAVLNSRRFGHA